MEVAMDTRLTEKHINEMNKKKLPIREPVVLPFKSDTSQAVIKAAVRKALSEYFPKK